MPSSTASVAAPSVTVPLSWPTVKPAGGALGAGGGFTGLGLPWPTISRAITPGDGGGNGGEGGGGGGGGASGKWRGGGGGLGGDGGALAAAVELAHAFYRARAGHLKGRDRAREQVEHERVLRERGALPPRRGSGRS